MSVKAVVTLGSRRMEVREVPDPKPGSEQALVRVQAVGLCGSDYHLYLGDHPYVTYPQTQGHEIAGVAETIDPDYGGPVRVGDRVAVEPLIPCGTCFPCRHGRPNCCTNLQVMGAHTTGALSEFVVVRTSSLYPVGDLDPELTALVEPMSIGLQAVNRAQLQKGEQIVVFGAGPIGQAVILAARDRGAEVLVIDQIASRLELSVKLGAERTVSAADDISAAVSEWTAGDGPAVVFDATGVPSVIRMAVDLVASSGRVVIIGLSNREVSIPVIEFTRKELTILGSRNNAGIFGDAVALVRRNRDKVRALITHRFPLQETGNAIEYAISHPETVEKIIIQVGSENA